MLTGRLPEGHERFEITTEHDGDTMIVAVAGDLDVYSASRLSAALERAVAVTSRLVLDLSETTFIDSTGLGAIVAGVKQARSLGGDLVLLRPQPAARRILAITGLDAMLVVRDA